MHKHYNGSLVRKSARLHASYQVLSPQLCWLLSRMASSIFKTVSQLSLGEDSFDTLTQLAQTCFATGMPIHTAGAFRIWPTKCLSQNHPHPRGTACTSCGKLVWPVTKLRLQPCHLVICRKQMKSPHLNSSGFGLQAKNRVMILLLRHFSTSRALKSLASTRTVQFSWRYLTGLVHLRNLL